MSCFLLNEIRSLAWIFMAAVKAAGRASGVSVFCAWPTADVLEN